MPLTASATTKEQSKTEAGWCKIRDGIVLPLVMQGSIYIIKLVLSKTTAQTAAGNDGRTA